MTSPRVPSLRSYAAALVALVLLLIGGFSWLVTQRVAALDARAQARNTGQASEEISQILAQIKERSTLLAQTFATWDETTQQFSNPTYYEYWRERRVAEARLAPPFFDSIELYDRQGRPLASTVAEGMPASVSGTAEKLMAEVDGKEGHAHLLHIYPLHQAGEGGQLRGYVVLQLDLQSAISTLQRFRYVDPDSVRLSGRQGELITGDAIADHLGYRLQPNWEFVQLEDILLRALWQFAIVASALLLLSVFLLVSLGSMPLARLSQQIDRLWRGERDDSAQKRMLLPLAEYNKVRASLDDYHARLTEGARALQESETRMRAVLHNVVDGILTFDAQGYVTSANPAVERIFGWSADELLQHQMTRLFVDLDPGELQRLAVRMEHGDEALPAQRMELLGKGRDGLQFPVELTLSRLPLPDSERFIAVVEDISERKASEQRLLYLANFDSLTGLPNRALLRDRLEHAMLQAERSDLLVGVLFLDLDRFKTINDTLGHHSGDQLLTVVAERLKRGVRSGDTVARLGGDEFMVVLEGMRHIEEASHVAQKLRAAFDEAILLNGREVFVTPSIGITIYPLDDGDADALLRNADSAMYRAKELGGDGIQFFTQDLNERAAERLSLESSLRQALTRNEFEVYYQPRIETASGRVVASEALLRWQHPEHGMVAPDRFIDILEEIGLIEAVGLWVLRSACSQAVAWHAAGFAGLRMAVNISPRQFRSQSLVEDVRQVLRDTGLPASCLELEITENVLVENVELTRATLQGLRAMGVHISLDDFGTGYSALAYLRQFPIDTMKIDRSFLAEVPDNEDDARLVSALVAIASSLGLRVTAEGVETEAQLAFLRRLGCQEVQGFLYARPLPVDRFRNWLGQGGAMAGRA